MKSQILFCFVVIFAPLFSCEESQPEVDNVIGSLYIGKELQPGNVITIKGTFSENEYRTNIDFENRPQCRWEQTNYTAKNYCIIALHSSFRFDENTIVRNFYKTQDHNRDIFINSPLQKGQNFTYKVTANNDNFQIEINGRVFPSFMFRTPLSNIKYITIYGDASIESITVEGDMLEIEGDNEHLKNESLNKAINGPINVNNVVGSLHLGKELRPGNVIVIKGTFSKDEYRTNIDLENHFKCKWEEDERKTTDADCIVAFQNSIRFDENTIVRNCYKNVWIEKEEERFGEFPFQKGQAFIYKINVKENHFEVEIDGKMFTMFMFRTPLSNIKYVTIYGNSGIRSIEIIDTTIITGELNKVSRKKSIILFSNIVGNLYLDKELKTGDAIVIKGTFPNFPFRTIIDLDNSEICTDDNNNKYSSECIVAMHNSIRFDERQVVILYSYKNDWDSAETNGVFPFGKGEEFIYKILVKDDHFEIEINGNKFTKFSYKKPLSNINYIHVYGDSFIHSVSLEEEEILTTNNVTGSLYIHKELHPGNVITIKGVFANNSLTSIINLENKHCDWGNNKLTGVNPDCLVAFHNSIRFEKNEIVRNTYKNEWVDDLEERHGGFPFEKGQHFVFKIFVKKDNFEVEIDRKKFTTFNYRMPLSVIKYVNIYGNILVNSMSIEEEEENSKEVVKVIQLDENRVEENLLNEKTMTLDDLFKKIILNGDRTEDNLIDESNVSGATNLLEDIVNDIVDESTVA